LLEVACHSVGVSLARLIDEHGPIPGCRICGRAPRRLPACAVNSGS